MDRDPEPIGNGSSELGRWILRVIRPPACGEVQNFLGALVCAPRSPGAWQRTGEPSRLERRLRGVEGLSTDSEGGGHFGYRTKSDLHPGSSLLTQKLIGHLAQPAARSDAEDLRPGSRTALCLKQGRDRVGPHPSSRSARNGRACARRKMLYFIRGVGRNAPPVNRLRNN